jgi:hypothetical protein
LGIEGNIENEVELETGVSISSDDGNCTPTCFVSHSPHGIPECEVGELLGVQIQLGDIQRMIYLKLSHQKALKSIQAVLCALMLPSSSSH